jgi:hypothetical protein
LAQIIQTKGRYDQDEKERVSAITCLLDHGADPKVTLGHNEYDRGESVFFQCIREESIEVVRLFGQYGATLPREMIAPLRTLWQMVSTPSAVLEEVISIMRRDYPEVDFDEKTDVKTAFEAASRHFPNCEIFWNTNTSAAVPALGAVAAMNVGMSRAFAAKYSAVARTRMLVNYLNYVSQTGLTRLRERVIVEEDNVTVGAG